MPERQSDFFYGARASFPKAVQWHVWFNYWKDHIHQMQPIDRFMVDFTVKLQQTLVKISQIIRQNAGYTRSYTDGEMRNIKDLAEEAAACYRRNRPSDDRIRSLDRSLVLLFQALDGAYSVVEALAAELDRINRRGFFMLNVNDERAEVVTGGTV